MRLCSFKIHLAAAAAVAVTYTASSAMAGTIATWTFETTAPTTAGPLAPEVGAGSATGSHVGASTYSSPAGNGSAHSFSSNTWAVDDYYQFQVSTTGQSGIGFQFDQTSSGTGPRDFKVQYSTDGSTFTDVNTYSVLANAAPNPVWNASTASPLYTTFVNLGTNSALDNQAAVYFRLVQTSAVSANGGTVATGGTDRVDNVSVVTNVPEPASLFLAFVAALSFAGIRRTKG